MGVDQRRSLRGIGWVGEIGRWLAMLVLNASNAIGMNNRKWTGSHRIGAEYDCLATWSGIITTEVRRLEDYLKICRKIRKKNDSGAQQGISNWCSQHETNSMGTGRFTRLAKPVGMLLIVNWMIIVFHWCVYHLFWIILDHFHHSVNIQSFC